MVKVNTCHGWLEGNEGYDQIGERKFFSFKGIPYAKAPVGKLRFKAPQPLDPWEGVKSAKEHGPVCHQYDMFTRKIVAGKEDCLYLNVYTRNINPNLKIPVMVWIHGGGFISGSGNSDFYGPDFLIHNDVVLVTFNYRLDVVGFLCLENENIPGNAGMKDQVAALRWVKENIKNFGGDPNNITIFGESAGSASVGYHLISPMSKGLFHKAIMQSGSITCDWAYGTQMKERAFALGKKLGLETNDPEELADFLMTKPIEELIMHQLPVFTHEACYPGVVVFMTPVVEKVYGDEEAFLTKPPIEYLKAGEILDVPIIIGHNADDGLIAFSKINEIVETINSYPQLILPLPFNWKFNLKEMMRLSEKVKNFYFKNNYISSSKHTKELIKYTTTYLFKYHDYRFIQYFQKSCNSKVYNYRLSVTSERNIMADSFMSPIKENIVCHSDDLMYLFDTVGTYNIPLDKNAKSYKMILKMCKLWTNFAKESNPTPNKDLGVLWKPYTKEVRNILDIDGELAAALCEDDDEIKLWDELFNVYDNKDIEA